MEPIFLSVIIPALNEAGRIKKTLIQIESYLNRKGYSYEIVVVDDGSIDNTAGLISEFFDDHGNGVLLKNKTKQGKGYAVREGMLKARGAYILFSDADLSTPIEEIEKFIPWLNQGYEIVIGSRGLKESNIVIHQSFYRETMGRIFNFLVQKLVISGIQDTQCGFKCFQRDIAQILFKGLSITGFCFDVELLFLASKMGLRIKEVPVNWYNSPDTKVNTIVDSFKMFWDLLKITRRKKTLF